MDRCYKDISRGMQWRVTGEIKVAQGGGGGLWEEVAFIET